MIANICEASTGSFIRAVDVYTVPGMPGSRSVHDPRGPVLVLDNYDSFTYNLVQYLGELGERPIVRRNDAITVDEIGQLGLRAVVISPGPCTPQEAGISVPLIVRWGPEIPILGVCLGTSGDRRSLWRASGACAPGDARQDVRDPA